MTKFNFAILSRLKTHEVFSKNIYDIIIKNKTFNFLRNSNIQNIFFIHNRFFILNELLELKRDIKRWSLWKTLLTENSVGDPVRYFLYPNSSGNRIRQVYHLKKYLDFCMYRPMKLLARSQRTTPHSLKHIDMNPTARIRRVKPPVIIWCVPTTTPTAYRCSPPTAPTTTARITSRKSSSR